MLRKSKSEKNPLLEPLEPLSIEALEFCVFSFNLGGYPLTGFEFLKNPNRLCG
jgi:hypothetical protein